MAGDHGPSVRVLVVGASGAAGLCQACGALQAVWPGVKWEVGGVSREREDEPGAPDRHRQAAEVRPVHRRVQRLRQGAWRLSGVSLVTCPHHVCMTSSAQVHQSPDTNGFGDSVVRGETYFVELLDVGAATTLRHLLQPFLHGEHWVIVQLRGDPVQGMCCPDRVCIPAGCHDRYKALRHLFYRDINAVIVVYDSSLPRCGQLQRRQGPPLLIVVQVKTQCAVIFAVLLPSTGGDCRRPEHSQSHGILPWQSVWLGLY